MITLLVGDNDFEKERTLVGIISSSKSRVEKYDGTTLDVSRLPDLLMGTTLFDDKRLIVIKNLSENSSVWTKLGDMIESVPSDTNLILVEQKPDKRSSAYKKLQKVANIVDHENLDGRDANRLVDWLKKEAKQMGLELDTKLATFIVNRVGFDQWQLFHALEKLSFVKQVTSEVIESVIDANPTENVFNLLETSIKGNRTKLAEMLRVLELSEDPHRLFSLLSTQAFQLAAVFSADESSNITSDFGIHPFVVGKFKALSRGRKRGEMKKIVEIFACADDDMKISKAEPWLLIEQALLKVALL